MSSGKDLHNAIDVRRSNSPTRIGDDTANVGQIIDRQDFESLEFAIAIGTLADADATFAVLVDDGDDSGLSDAAAVADGFLYGTEALAGFTFANDDEVRKIGYRGSKRYVRLTITPTNNSGNADISAVAILSGARKEPQSSQT